MCGGEIQFRIQSNEFVTESKSGRKVQKTIGNCTASASWAVFVHILPLRQLTLDELGKSVSTHDLL